MIGIKQDGSRINFRARNGLTGQFFTWIELEPEDNDPHLLRFIEEQISTRVPAETLPAILRSAEDLQRKCQSRPPWPSEEPA